jgi:hypothetical protein
MFQIGEMFTHFIVTAQTFDLGPTRGIRPEERADYPWVLQNVWGIALAASVVACAALAVYLWRRRAAPSN